MPSDVPSLAVLIDIPLGILMWLAVTRFILLLFIGEDSRATPMRQINTIIGPMVRLLESLSPGWISYRVTPLLLAVIILLVRYYLIPIIGDYPVTGIADMPLEGLLIGAFSELPL